MLASGYSKEDSSEETVRILLENGANPNLQAKYGWTALIMASRYSKINSSEETVRILLENGADPKIKDKNGNDVVEETSKYVQEIENKKNNNSPTILANTNSTNRQKYKNRPLKIDEVRGESSKTIFRFMTGLIAPKQSNEWYPSDMDDFERNRALLLMYPEWRPRLKEMKVLSKEWFILVEFWDIIEQLYINENFDIDQYNVSYSDFGSNRCTKLILALIKK
jgi:hypothetical protein